jgi:hypothetical protein
MCHNLLLMNKKLEGEMSQLSYLPKAGSLNQDEPFNPDLVTGHGRGHRGDETPLQCWAPAYDAWAVIQMNNLVVGLTPYLPPFSRY